MSDSFPKNNSSRPPLTHNHPPTLVVDMDGTLLATDSLLEGLCARLCENPLIFPKVLHLSLKDRLALKWAYLDHPENIALYPLRPETLACIEEAREKGHQVWLATASPEPTAKIVAERVGLFDGVLASTPTTNLKGEKKAELLSEKFGEGNFDYLGDSPIDASVWKAAREALVASSNSAVVAAAKKANRKVRYLPSPKPGIKAYARALRIGHWVKNLLLFVPLFLAHDFTGMNFVSCIVAFFSFGFCSSGIYVVNDLVDLANDRRHPLKKFRPFASGEIPLHYAPLLFAGCIMAAFLLALFLPPLFFLVLLLYIICTFLYSFFLKKYLFLDVIFLSALYVLRIIGGAVTIGIFPSNWLTGFAGFFFLGLALIKRADLIRNNESGEYTPGRAYMGVDSQSLEMMAVSSGFSSILIMALYIDSLQASELYSQPAFLWLACPLLVYWYGRIIIFSRRGALADDPVNFAIRDKISWLIGFLAVGVFLISI